MNGTTLYLAEDEANLEFAKWLFETFYLAMGIKINWQQSIAIWASKKLRNT